MGRAGKLSVPAYVAGDRTGFLSELVMYARFAGGLPRFLQGQVTLEQAEDHLRRRLQEREANFLRLLERGVYGYRRSPYLPMLKLAGCELGDVRAMVHSRGLEATLLVLREAGVYASFEEFKGREPIVRGGRVLAARPRDFDNPYLRAAYSSTTGGASGAGMRVSIDLNHWRSLAVGQILIEHAHGIAGVPTAIWRGILPEPTGLSTSMVGARIGNVPRQWFTPFDRRDLKPALKYRLATYAAIGLARAVGVRVPWPEQVPPDDASIVARWAADTVRAEGACVVKTSVSRALRVSLAAQEQGFDLRGAAFWGGGEPPTAAKVREITSSGARWIPYYSFTESGRVGVGCTRPADENDLHFMKDRQALIQHPHAVPGTGTVVPAFHFTTLLPSAPKLLLNVESDDYGEIEPSACGCPLERYGFTEHLRGVRSFGKLTGEGVTLVGSEMVRILEEVLPARFGGSPLDYQLLEEEDERGFTRLSLIASPRIEVLDEAALVHVVLDALGRGSVAADIARATWEQAESLRVRRQEPIWTARGKLLPLHLAQRDSGGPSSSARQARGPRDCGR